LRGKFDWDSGTLAPIVWRVFPVNTGEKQNITEGQCSCTTINHWTGKVISYSLTHRISFHERLAILRDVGELVRGGPGRKEEEARSFGNKQQKFPPFLFIVVGGSMSRFVPLWRIPAEWPG